MAALNLESAEAIAADAIANQKVRAFDVYALGPFLIYAAFASRKGALSRWPRRILFSAGVFAIIYNFSQYKKLAQKVTAA